MEPSDEASWNIILASVARANQNLDQATIDKAMECWAATECDTGTGGDVVMGYADGGGLTTSGVTVTPHGGDPPGAHLPGDREDDVP